METWDIFISHASEDKDSFVGPLAQSLEQLGYAVWYDQFTLKLGDSLRESIDRGLRHSRYGVVVLSKAFFQKRWTQIELGALIEREGEEAKVILPVWHGVEVNEVRAVSPILADRLAVKSSQGIDIVVKAIIDVAGNPVKKSVTELIANLELTGSDDDLENIARNIWWAAEVGTYFVK